MNAKLLLVDDDTTLLRFMGEYFQGTEFTAIIASNGPEALRLAYHEHPDLAVLDVMMPGMDGWEVTRRLREMADLPIILLTGKNSEEDKLRGFQLGVDDYITKPFSFAELTARIQAVLSRARHSGQEKHNVVPIGDLLLDLDKHELRQGSQVINLTPTEYRLLEILAQTPGKALAESELVQAIWGSDRPEDTTAIRRYIWLLRQKIEPDPARPVRVLTVRGFGYRLETG
jgi:two-component system, OmpR family, alkaline phosphatase synthesis response regulator PhoP